MRVLLLAVMTAGALAAQEKGGSISPIRIGPNGWPVGDALPGSPAVEPAPVGRPRSPASTKRAQPATPSTEREPDTARSPLGSGMELDSPLHDVFRCTRSPGAMRALGGVEVVWRLTIHDSTGKATAYREFHHLADLSSPARDRLEYRDDVFARYGERVVAFRGDLPWEPLLADAAAKLELFGMHLRMPWCFGDGRSYAILKKDVVRRREEDLVRLSIERRPTAGDEVFGPVADPRPRDRFELLYEPTTGRPRELVHQFAGLGRRRVLFEEWVEFERSISYPRRRIYVDDDLRKTITLEVLDMRRHRVGERDFRMP